MIYIFCIIRLRFHFLLQFSFHSRIFCCISDAHLRSLRTLLFNNKTLTINCLLLWLGGDIELNPGDKCDLCSKTVKSNQRGIQCDKCDRWYHAKCCEVSKELYNVLANSPCIWLCPRCTLPKFNDSFFEDPLDKVLSTNSFDSLQKLDCKDGEQNSSLSPLPEVHQNWKPMKRRTELKCLLINCPSIKNKIPGFAAVVEEHKPDVIFGNESWLHSEILNMVKSSQKTLTLTTMVGCFKRLGRI